MHVLFCHPESFRAVMITWSCQLFACLSPKACWERVQWTEEGWIVMPQISNTEMGMKIPVDDNTKLIVEFWIDTCTLQWHGQQWLTSFHFSFMCWSFFCFLCILDTCARYTYYKLQFAEELCYILARPFDQKLKIEDVFLKPDIILVSATITILSVCPRY